LLRHEKNKGKGEAIKTGLKHVIQNFPEAKYFVLLDADLQYLPEEVPKILEPLVKGEADFVIGYRDWRKVPFRHRLGNWVWRTFFNLLFGTNFKDTNCGFMGVNLKAAKIIVDVLHGGYIIENTIFVQILKNKLRTKQVPVLVFYKKKSGILRGMRVVLGVLSFIIKEGIKYRLEIF
jgi:glycosyltransferase involved in cell wall biosynthesis